jgi:predicted phage terminase large subunit-like protein
MTRVRPNLSKIELFGRAALAVADGLVFIPEEAPWLEAFLFEVAAFPNIADKDQADSMSQLLAYRERALYMARSELRRR